MALPRKVLLARAKRLYFNGDPVGPVELQRRADEYYRLAGLVKRHGQLMSADRAFWLDDAQDLGPVVNRGAW